jgi:rod shape-determining protein MreC
MLFVGLSIAIMLFDAQTTYFVEVRSFLSDVVSPLQRVINWPVDVIDWIDTSVATRSMLTRENASLKAQQLLLSAQLEKLMALQKENDQLRALLETSPKIDSNKILVAQVLAVDVAPFLKQVVIDRGTNQGVFVGQAVIDATGVVGQVVQVSNFTSRIMLLTDTESSIPVEDTRNNLRGIVNGSGSYSELELVHMPATSDIQVGDKLVSSGLGLRYPVGYPVGVVTDVKHDPSQPFLHISVEPSGALSSTRLVLLIWPAEQKVITSAKQQLTTMEAIAKKRQASPRSLS